MMRFLILFLFVASSMVAFAQSPSRLSLAAPVKPPTPTGIIYPQDFGAKCDGVANDTTALRQAIVAADTPPYSMIQLPGSTCRFTDTLVFGARTDRYSYVSVQGISEYASRLSYVGPADRPAILISHMSAFRWSSFSVIGSSRGSSSVGVLLDGPFGSGGTMNTTITFDHVSVGGFSLGMLAGNTPGDAASEIECRNCRFDNNDIGWTASGYNSLNFWFYNVALTANAVGIKIGGPWATDAPHIIGGSSAGNSVADIECANGFGALSIENFRAEVSSTGKFIRGVGCGQSVSIRNSVILSSGAVAAPVMDLSAWETITIADSIVAGQMVVANHPLTLRIENTTTYEGSPNVPVIWSSQGPQKISFLGNVKYLTADPIQWFPDIGGFWNGSAIQP